MDFFKSKQTLHRYPTDFLIGDLLVKAGVISQNKLDEAIKLSGAKHLQLGQMLIMSGAINAAQLQAAVDTQSLVRDRTIDLNEALKVLKQACKSGQSIADVLASAQTKQSGSTNKLGEVLLEAGLINSDQFSKAMQRSLATGLPLGRILVLNNTLADSVLSMALDLQVRIRDEMITRLEAIDALRSSAGIDGDDMPDPNRVAQAQAALKAPRKHGVRIGEMFVRAGLLTETDVMNALETGLATDQLIGQVLVGQGFITEQILEAALGLQKMVDSNHLEVEKAVDTLSMIQSQGITYDEAVESLHIVETTTAETISFDHMLVLARVLTESEIADAFHAAMEQAKIVGQILMMTGHIDKHTLKAALRAHFLLQKGAISQDDAVVGLDYCMHSSSKLSFDGALQELGWDISTLPHDDVDPEIRAMEEARKDFGVTSEDELNKFAGEHSSATETTDAVPVIDEELTAAQEEAELRSRIESREPLDGDEIQIRSGSYDEQAEPAEAVSEVAEEEGWEPPVEAAQEEQKEGAEQKRSLSGLLSHEDLEPVEEQEETPAAKKPGKFANLLSDEEKKPAVAEKTETPPASTKGGKFANLLNADEPPAKKVADDTKDEEDKEAAAKAAAEKEAAEKEAAAKKAAEIVAREKAEVEMLAEQIRAAEKAAQEKKAVEKAAADKAAAEKAEKEAAEKAAAEKAEAEKAAAEKVAAEKAAAEKAAAEKLAAEKAAAEKAAAEKAAAEKAAAEKAAAAAATPAAATAATTAPAAAADAANKKVGAFQSLLGSETAKAAPAAAPAQSAPPAAAPAQPAPAATPGATPAATPNVAAALTALTRAHPPGAAAAPGTVPPAQAAPAAAARPAAPAPAAAAAPGAPKISPSQIPGAPRPAVPAAQTAPNAVAASPGGPNGSGQAPGAPPRVAVPPGAAAQTVAPGAAVGAPTAPAPTGQPAAAAPAAARSEEDIKGALSGAHARLAESYYDQGNYSEALSLYEKILAVREQELGESDNELVADLANVVRVLCVQNRLDNAESYVRRMIGILEMSQPEDVQKLAETLNTLSQIYFQQKKFEQCQPVLDRAVRLKQQVLGEDHVDMADYYRDYARLLRNLNRPEEAEQFYSRAKLILGKTPKQAVV